MKRVITLAVFSALLITLSGCHSEADELSGPLNNAEIESVSKSASKEAQLSDVNLKSTPLYRFLKNGKHLYTKDLNEGYSNGYSYEGIIGYISYESDGKPLTRWYNRKNGDRLITTNPDELANDLYSNFGFINAPGMSQPVFGNPSNSWIYEQHLANISTYAPPAKSQVYRYYNPSKNDHLFTSTFNELGNGGNGYVYEGVAFWISTGPY